MELEAVARAEKAGRAEAEGLRAALAGAEVVRKNLEEGSQRELEEVQRLHQEQVNVGVGRVQFHNGELAVASKQRAGTKKATSSGVMRFLEGEKTDDLERGRTWVFWAYSDRTFFQAQVTPHHLKPSFPFQ